MLDAEEVEVSTGMGSSLSERSPKDDEGGYQIWCCWTGGMMGLSEGRRFGCAFILVVVVVVRRWACAAFVGGWIPAILAFVIGSCKERWTRSALFGG